MAAKEPPVFVTAALMIPAFFLTAGIWCDTENLVAQAGVGILKPIPLESLICQERGTMEFRIYYEDTDAGGVVYHANYLGFFERGRTEYFRERGLNVAELARNGQIFPVVRLEVDYRFPAVLDDLIRVETEVLEIGKTSFTLGQQALRVFDGKLLASGKVTLVCVSPAMKAKRLPQELLQVLEG